MDHMDYMDFMDYYYDVHVVHVVHIVHEVHTARQKWLKDLNKRNQSQGGNMSILGAIIIGFVVGLIARAVLPGNHSIGIILTILLGIGGALVGKFVGQGLGMYQPDQPAGFIMSVIGAMILLLICHFFYNASFRDRV